MSNNVPGKDLTKESPRSPRVRIGGYPILARTIDKCRALVSGNIGGYDFDCPLDNMLFGFKGVTADEFKGKIAQGASDVEMLSWFNQQGSQKTPAEIESWSDAVENMHPYDDSEGRHPLAPSRDWFLEQITPLGLDPKTSTLFDYLEADDNAMLRTSLTAQSCATLNGAASFENESGVQRVTGSSPTAFL